MELGRTQFDVALILKRIESMQREGKKMIRKKYF